MKRRQLIGISRDGTASIVLAEPIACPSCNRSVMFLVNRLGCTRCVECDGKEQRGREEPPPCLSR